MKLMRPLACMDFGDFLSPLNLPGVVREHRTREMPPSLFVEERQKGLIGRKHTSKNLNSQDLFPAAKRLFREEAQPHVGRKELP